jgi:hypothetical protein
MPAVPPVQVAESCMLQCVTRYVLAAAVQVVSTLAARVLPAEAGAAYGAAHTGQGHIHAGVLVYFCSCSCRVQSIV